jgi:hypothetical protein
LYTVVNVPVEVILKIVPEPVVPPPDVVPYNYPSLAWIGGAAGPPDGADPHHPNASY